jgi:hypothetical protein
VVAPTPVEPHRILESVDDLSTLVDTLFVDSRTLDVLVQYEGALLRLFSGYATSHLGGGRLTGLSSTRALFERSWPSIRDCGAGLSYV